MMTFKKFSYESQILESHLDTFGHVNNANYLVILEQARWHAITAGGYGLEKIQQVGLGPTILEINIKYKRELKNRELIKTTFQVQEIKGKVMYLIQQIYKENGDLACEAEYKIGFFDLKARKLINHPSDWLKACGLEATSQS
jgi:acyl-CoA thioester hydrolase